MEITITKAKPSDWKTIVNFQQLMAQETENITLDANTLEKGVRKVFDNPALGQYYIAKSNDKIIASLMTTFEWSDWRNATVWWLQSVFVIPEFRQKGIFKKMYLHLKEQVMLRDDVTGIRLYMIHSNHNAAKVYEAMGMDGEYYKMFEWMK